MARATKKKETRRGRPEAIAKRQAARSLNAMFASVPTTTGMDGRTLKRKKRLIQELKEGKGGEPLKAHEVLAHANELFGYGVTLSSLRKMKPRLPPTPPLTPETIETIKATQEAYSFHPNAWKLLGLDIDALDAAGSAEGEAAPKAKRARKAGGRKKKAA